MSTGEHDFDLMACIQSLNKIALNHEQAGDGTLAPLEVRIRATLALAVFLPHPQAKKHLINLMASSDIPREIRSVASSALTGSSNA
ncbi:MAG TPA: hypothetical protein VFE29_02375 [Terriglobia bacterium]|nr:hypothetical protein [Terriglobia bacterium]